MLSSFLYRNTPTFLGSAVPVGWALNTINKPWFHACFSWLQQSCSPDWARIDHVRQLWDDNLVQSGGKGGLYAPTYFGSVWIHRHFLYRTIGSQKDRFWLITKLFVVSLWHIWGASLSRFCITLCGHSRDVVLIWRHLGLNAVGQQAMVSVLVCIVLNIRNFPSGFGFLETAVLQQAHTKSYFLFVCFGLF